jgi:hypothetical protein
MDARVKPAGDRAANGMENVCSPVMPGLVPGISGEQTFSVPLAALSHAGLTRASISRNYCHDG